MSQNQSTENQMRKKYLELFEERKKKFSIPPPPNQRIYEHEEMTIPRDEDEENR